MDRGEIFDIHLCGSHSLTLFADGELHLNLNRDACVVEGEELEEIYKGLKEYFKNE